MSEAAIPTWIGPALVAPIWGVGSVALVLRGWRATADLFIAIVALLRGRMSPERALGGILAALITGVFCSALLRGGFWLLVEVMGFGRTWREQIFYWVSVAVAAPLLLRRLPSQLENAWRNAMTLESASGERVKEEH